MDQPPFVFRRQDSRAGLPRLILDSTYEGRRAIVVPYGKGRVGVLRIHRTTGGQTREPVKGCGIRQVTRQADLPRNDRVKLNPWFAQFKDGVVTQSNFVAGRPSKGRKNKEIDSIWRRRRESNPVTEDFHAPRNLELPRSRGHIVDTRLARGH